MWKKEQKFFDTTIQKISNSLNVFWNILPFEIIVCQPNVYSIEEEDIYDTIPHMVL